MIKPKDQCSGDWNFYFSPSIIDIWEAKYNGWKHP